MRIRLQLDHRTQELALFNLAIDSKLRGYDLVGLHVRRCDPGELCRPARDRHAEEDFATGAIRGHRTNAGGSRCLDRGRPPEAGAVPLSEPYVGVASPFDSAVFPRIVHTWAESIGLDPAAYGTHSMRRTKPTLIYRRTRNLRAVQLLLGHTKLESTVRYLGVEVDDALEIAEQTEV